MGVSFIEISIIKPPDRVQDVFSYVVSADINQETMMDIMKTVGMKKIMARNKNEDTPARLILNLSIN